MANSEGSLEQGANEVRPEQGLPVPRPPPPHLRLVSVCEPMTSNIHDDEFRARPPAFEQPRLSRRTTAQGLLDRSVQAQIGRMLRDVFSGLAEEPVPDRFVRLLEALEAQEKLR